VHKFLLIPIHQAYLNGGYGADLSVTPSARLIDGDSAIAHQGLEVLPRIALNAAVPSSSSSRQFKTNLFFVCCKYKYEILDSNFPVNLLLHVGSN
jgi:hypothetical protein